MIVGDLVRVVRSPFFTPAVPLGSVGEVMNFGTLGLVDVYFPDRGVWALYESELEVVGDWA